MEILKSLTFTVQMCKKGISKTLFIHKHMYKRTFVSWKMVKKLSKNIVKGKPTHTHTQKNTIKNDYYPLLLCSMTYNGDIIIDTLSVN